MLRRISVMAMVFLLGSFIPTSLFKLQAQETPVKPKTADQSSTDETANEYTCPMHPEIRSETKGVCPKCEMALISVIPAIAEDFNLIMEATPKLPKPQEKLHLRFSIFNPRTGELVRDFQLLHEKKFHLFIVSQDMREFQHIHPLFETDGSFTIETALPRPGNYKIYSDFHPTDGVPQVIQRNLQTAGYINDLYAAKPKLGLDATLSKIISGEPITAENAGNLGVDLKTLRKKPINPTKIELKLEPAEIIAGRPVTLTFLLSDAKTGEPLRDLLPYLGAMGHTLILSEDQTDYVHTHPEESQADVDEIESFLGGPQVVFEALFPRPGTYRIWTQFLRSDKIITVTFTVKVDRLQ